MHYFSVFCERDIICIRTQTNKGMVLKNAGGGGGGGGGGEVDKIFAQCHGGGGRFASHVFLRGGIFFWGGGPTNFAKPLPPPPSTVNNERSLRNKRNTYNECMMHTDTQCPFCTLCHHKADLADYNQFHDQDHLHLFPLLVFLLMSQPGKGENRSGVRAYWFILGLLSSWFGSVGLGFQKLHWSARLKCAVQ